MELTTSNKIPIRKILLLIITILLVINIVLLMYVLIANETRQIQQADMQAEFFDEVRAANELAFNLLFYYDGETYFVTTDARWFADGWQFDLRRLLLREENPFTEFVILPDGQNATSYLSPHTIVAWPSPLTFGLIESFNFSSIQNRQQSGEQHPFYLLIAEDLLTHHRQIYDTWMTFDPRLVTGDEIRRHQYRAGTTHGELQSIYLEALLGGDTSPAIHTENDESHTTISTSFEGLPQLHISPEEWDAFYEQLEKIRFARDMHFNFSDDTGTMDSLLDLRIALQRRLRGANVEIPFTEIAFATSREDAAGFSPTTLVAYPTEITQGIADGINYFTLFGRVNISHISLAPITFPQDFVFDWRKVHRFFQRYDRDRRLEILARAQELGESAYQPKIEAAHRTLELINNDFVIFNHILRERRWVSETRNELMSPPTRRTGIRLEFEDIAMAIETYGVDGLFAITHRMQRGGDRFRPTFQSFSYALQEFHVFGARPAPSLSTLLNFESFLAAELYPRRMPNSRWFLEDFYFIYRDTPNPEALAEVWALGSFSNWVILGYTQFSDGYTTLSLPRIRYELRKRGVEEFIELLKYAREFNWWERIQFHMVTDSFDNRHR